MEALERKNAELTALFEISKTLSSSFELEKNLERAMEILSELLEMSRGTITLFNPATGELRITVAHGLTTEQIRRGVYRIGEGVVGKVVETGEPIAIPDIGKEPMFLNRTGARISKENISFLCVPIKIKGEILGVLSVDRIFEEPILLEEDLRVLEIIATLIAQAIKVHQRFEEERKKREELALELRSRLSLPDVVSISDKMQEVIKTCIKAAKSKATILLRGESGTGKELLARGIHQESPRSKGPFVAINCAALPENLLEAELFGYEKGAFTGAVQSKPGRFELADKGTLFLDEIGDISPSIQVKLLRVLQDQTFERLGGTKSIKVDVRIVAATNRDLESMTKAGTFREDLYWRLNVVPVFIPPLRDRREDIPLLIDHFVNRFVMQYDKNVTFSPEALNSLIRYHWPGNVRELENTIERLIVLSEDEIITVEDLPSYILKELSLETDLRRGSACLSEEIEEIERVRILNALHASNFNQAKAARALGITQRQIGYKIKKYNIVLPKKAGKNQ